MTGPWVSGALLLLAAAPAGRSVSTFSGRYYEPGSQRKTLLFTSEGRIETVGAVRTQHSVFMDPEGHEAVVEDARFIKGRVDSFRVEQKQLGAVGTVEVRGGKVHFSWTEGQQTKTAEEDLDPDFIVGAGIYELLQSRWDKLLAGETLKVRFGVLDRLETVGFKFFKDRELQVEGRDCVAITMKPTNVFIMALVEPLTFVFTKDGQHMLEIHGRASPKVKVGGAWKPASYEAVFAPLVTTHEP